MTDLNFAIQAAGRVRRHFPVRKIPSVWIYTDVFTVLILHCENIRISTDILWRVFHVLMEPVPYTFVSVNRRNNEARAHITLWVWGPTVHHIVFFALA